MEQRPITNIGLKKIEEELDTLVKNDRETIKVAIAEARELGDLKENAEYHAAKEKQGIIEGRISQLQGVIASAQVVNPSTISLDRIVFGATVTLCNEERESTTYQIVGEDESNKSAGRISFKSPLGAALIGKEEGDTVVVKAPKGDIIFEIEEFEYV